MMSVVILHPTRVRRKRIPRRTNFDDDEARAKNLKDRPARIKRVEG